MSTATRTATEKFLGIYREGVEANAPAFWFGSLLPRVIEVTGADPARYMTSAQWDALTAPPEPLAKEAK